jgi:hypothetical protein
MVQLAVLFIVKVTTKNKEVGMKKILVIMIALLLAAPVMSFAGSATSRFDMTIGGNVNFNFGYSTQNYIADGYHAPMRGSGTATSNLNDDRGNVRYSLADSQINFLSRGPDTFGAKTMAFLQIDFRGSNTGNVVGGAQLQYAFVKFDWASSYLVMGKAGAETLSAYARKFIIAGDASSTEGIGGIRPIQIAYRQTFAKNFNAMFGLIQHTAQDGAGGNVGNNNGYGRSQLPAVQAELGFSSDACGKIGPDALKFGLGALAGREYRTVWNNVAAAPTGAYNDTNVNVWMVGLRGFIPIIPEKQNNKKNALSLSAIGYVGQNAWNYVGSPAAGVGSYYRPVGAGGLPANAASPTMYGGFAQLTYYINDTTYVNAQYGVLKQNYSSAARNAAANTWYNGVTFGANETNWAGPDAINQFRVYGASIFNDPSPSIRIGFEFLRMVANYNGFGRGSFAGQSQAPSIVGVGNLDSKGTNDQYKAMVMYFF